MVCFSLPLHFLFRTRLRTEAYSSLCDLTDAWIVVRFISPLSLFVDG